MDHDFAVYKEDFWKLETEGHTAVQEGVKKRLFGPRAERYEKAQERQQGQYALVAALNQVENVTENLISQTSVP